jgi:hypothetical protein
MYYTIIKIDACGSKDYVTSSSCLDAQDMRTILFTKIANVVKEIYPNTDKEFPEGAIYSGQGDCIYILLDNPDYAIRSTIEFQKKWYEYSTDYPDCRAVIDYDAVIISDAINRKEAISEALENVNLIEKIAGYNGPQVLDKELGLSA